jgi:hypothetical protein
MTRRIRATELLTTLSILAVAIVGLPEVAAAVPQVAVGGQQGETQDMSATPEAQILREVLQTGVAHEDIVRKSKVNFFPAPDGNTFMMLVFEVDQSGLTFAPAPPPAMPAEGEAAAPAAPVGDVASMKAYGAVTTQGPEGQLEIAHQFMSPFALPAEGGDGTFSDTYSVGMTLVPGTYTLTWGLIEASTNLANVTTEVIEVPNYTTGELKMTSVFVSAASEPQSTAFQADTVYPGIRMGNITFFDDIDREVPSDAMIEVIYVVMGTQQDPTTLRPKLEVNYRILLDDPEAEEEQSVARFPTQTLETFSVGQPIPLAQIQNLEAGKSYFLEIEVKDLISAQQLLKRIPFSLLPEEEG